MSRAIDMLKHEHDAIIAALNILDTMTQQISADQTVEGDDIAALLGIFEEFADRCHHGKEEKLLFPALAEGAAGPLAMMMAEHEQGRSLMRQMREAAEPPLDLMDFSQAARSYSTLLRAHIEKENTVLFPMAEEMLSQTRLDSLADAFETHEIQAVGRGRHDELHGVIKRLQKRYLM